MNLFIDEITRSLKFWEAILKKPEVNWFSTNTVVYEDNAIVLRRFCKGTSGAGILIVPPQAGHSSIIADFYDKKSIVQTAKRSTNHSVYAIEWKSCTYERRNEDLDDLTRQALTAKEACLKEVDKLHIVGLCQGGWLAAILTYLYPEMVTSLVVAGSPINLALARENSSVCKCVEMYPQAFYRNLVSLGGGLMCGEFMLAGWKASNFSERYIGDTIRLYNASKNDEAFNKVNRDRNWYEYTQNVSGNWYLEVVDRMFRKNDLWNQQMEIHGKIVKLQNIKVPVVSVAGGKDDITPPAQALALPGQHHTIPKVGHIGIYVSAKSQPIWANILKSLPTM